MTFEMILLYKVHILTCPLASDMSILQCLTTIKTLLR